MVLVTNKINSVKIDRYMNIFITFVLKKPSNIFKKKRTKKINCKNIIDCCIKNPALVNRTVMFML